MSQSCPYPLADGKLNPSSYFAMQVVPPGQRPAKRPRLQQQLGAAATDPNLSDLSGVESEGERATGQGGPAGAGDGWAPGIVAGIARRSRDQELLVQVGAGQGSVAHYVMLAVLCMYHSVAVHMGELWCWVPGTHFLCSHTGCPLLLRSATPGWLYLHAHQCP